MAARVFRGCRTLMAAASAEGGASSTKTAGKTKTAANGGGLMKPVPVSPEMKKFLGVSEVSRSQAVKRIWDYIKLHDLQVLSWNSLLSLKKSSFLLHSKPFEERIFLGFCSRLAF